MKLFGGITMYRPVRKNSMLSAGNWFMRGMNRVIWGCYAVEFIHLWYVQ